LKEIIGSTSAVDTGCLCTTYGWTGQSKLDFPVEKWMLLICGSW